jgi:hypothetical protein
MSAEYHSSDRHQLVILAVLMDDFFDPDLPPTARVRLSAEIRQLGEGGSIRPTRRRMLKRAANRRAAMAEGD